MAYEVDHDTIAMVVAARYGGDSLTLAERPIAARRLFAEGLDARQIADILGVTDRTIYRYVADEPRTGIPGWTPYRICGRVQRYKRYARAA